MSSIKFNSENNFLELEIVGNFGVGDYITFSLTGEELRVVACNGTTVYFDETFIGEEKDVAIKAFAEMAKACQQL